MSRASNRTLALAAGGLIGLLALSSRRASASTPAKKKPVRGVVTVGEPVMIINGKRTPLSDRRAPVKAPAKAAPKKTAVAKAPAKKAAPKSAPQGQVSMGEPMMIKNGKRVPLSDRRSALTSEPPAGEGIVLRSGMSDVALLAIGHGMRDGLYDRQPVDYSNLTQKEAAKLEAANHMTDAEYGDAMRRAKGNMSDLELLEIGHAIRDGLYENGRAFDTSHLTKNEQSKLEEANRMDDAQYAAAMRRAKRAAQLAAKRDTPNAEDDTREKLQTTLSVPPISKADESLPPDYYDLRSGSSANAEREAGMRQSDDYAQPVNYPRARKNAATVAKMIKVKKQQYDRDQVRGFQRDAGMLPDGLYGPVTRGALRHFGVKNPPDALYQPAGAPTYIPSATR